MISLKNITKSYADGKSALQVLDGINLNINHGEIIAIMGKSGSGKTTLLNILGGLLQPNEGEVLIDNQNIYQMSDTQRCIFRRQSVGFVYQTFDLFPELSVYDNIILPLLLDKKKIDIAYFEDVTSKLEIFDKQNKLPRELSGGEQQRVAIARAIINSPKLLLCDEPTGNLDEETAEKIMQVIKDINSKYNTTVIIATHDLDIANSTNKIYNIQNGKII